MQKFAIVENAKIQARMLLKGMAVPHLIHVPDDKVLDDVEYVYGVNDQKRYVVSEKVWKFNKKALRNMGKTRKAKTNSRLVGGEDTMIMKVGTPGSPERKEALAQQYAAILACGEEVSPFAWKE